MNPDSDSNLIYGLFAIAGAGASERLNLGRKWQALGLSGVILASVLLTVAAMSLFQSSVVPGVYSSSTPCPPVSLKVSSPNSPGGIIVDYPVQVDYHFEIWRTSTPGVPANTDRPPDQQWYDCGKLVVNDGLDILASLDGQNKSGSPVWMEASTGTEFGATNTTCTHGLTTNGFTLANTSTHYAHSTGTATYTLHEQWNYTGSSSVVVSGACLMQHSGAYDGTGAAGATHTLVDETVTATTGTVNTSGDKISVTATITV